MNSATYGVLAERYGRNISLDVPLVVFDQGGAAEALRDCAARRSRNESFAVRPILIDETAARVDAISSVVLSSFRTIDDRRQAIEQAAAGVLSVNNGPLSAIAVYDGGALRLMRAAVGLANVVAVTSEAERRRIERILSIDAQTAIVRGSDVSVPLPATPAVDRSDKLLIWAPHLSGEAASAFVIALSELHMPIRAICGSPLPESVPAEWTPLERAEDALRDCTIVVDTSAHGADAAIALAEWNVPVVVDRESGAREWFSTMRSYDRSRPLSLFEAVVSALGKGPSRANVRALTEPLVPSESPTVQEPLVSIVIPTYDRPLLIDYALESARRQTYRNSETIVVVDGGPRLDHLAAKYPNVRFEHMERNNPLVSCNRGFELAKGKYVTFLNDDDLFFPDHVSALAGALERSGASVAHGDVLTAFLEGSDDDGWTLRGFESNMSRAVERASILVSNQIGMISCMFRRECFDDGPPFEEAVPLYRDYAMWIRLASRFDFVHVERITSCYTIRNGGAQQQSKMWYDKALRSYEVLYAQYPVEGRPTLERRRAEILEAVKQGTMGIADAVPAGAVAPAPWPLWRESAFIA